MPISCRASVALWHILPASSPGQGCIAKRLRSASRNALKRFLGMRTPTPQRTNLGNAMVRTAGKGNWAKDAGAQLEWGLGACLLACLPARLLACLLPVIACLLAWLLACLLACLAMHSNLIACLLVCLLAMVRRCFACMLACLLACVLA